MTITAATEKQIPNIISIAQITWNETYRNIIPQDQIDYMLQLFYTHDVLAKQMRNPYHHFWILTNDDQVWAYTHCIEDTDDATLLKISKLYILPKHQGKGIGKLFLFFIENQSVTLHKNRITLNVNRHNPAKEFYQRMGFEIVEEVDIPLDKYWLNDYIMEKNLAL